MWQKNRASKRLGIRLWNGPRGLIHAIGIIWCLGTVAGIIVPWWLNVSIPWRGGYHRMDIRCSRGVFGLSHHYIDAVALTRSQDAQGPHSRLVFRLVSIQQIARLGTWQVPAPPLLSRWIGGVGYGDVARESGLPGRMPYVDIAIGILPQLAIVVLLVWRSVRWSRRVGGGAFEVGRLQ